MSIIRGNDELAFWLKQAKEGSDIEVTIAFSLHGLSRCPVCHAEMNLFRSNHDKNSSRMWDKNPIGYKEMMQHITITHMQNYDREIGKAFHTKREYIREGNRIKLGPIVFYKFYTEYEMDVLNKTIAMVQILVKYEANSIRNNHKQARKRAECMYRLSKEFLLTEKQIVQLVNLAPGSHHRIYEILATGLDEYYGGEKNYPIWMQRALGVKNEN